MPKEDRSNQETKNDNNSSSDKDSHRIIVIGGSSGGFEAFKTIVKNLPDQINASIFIVWHMSPDIRGVLPQVLNRQGNIYAAHARDYEEILPNRIYVAPPDHHLLLEKGHLRVTRGPKENRFRPAIDPLFRSAAYSYGKRVIGVVVSGALDDGTAGLWAVKHYGGLSIVQDPSDAEVSSMPENAMRQVQIDYCLPVSEISSKLVELSAIPVLGNTDVMKDELTKREIEIASEENALEKGVLAFGDFSPYTCPECHGVLSRLQNDNLVRYRCHTGHAYSVDTLIAAVTEKIEDNLYNAIRAMDESIMLLNHIGDHHAEANQPKLAALYFKKAKDASDRSRLVRQAALTHEQVSKDSLKQEAEENDE